jgi:putative ABC transport system permease protein
MVSTIAQDVRYAIRLLRRTPGPTAVAIITLALGIGANTAIFSVVNGVLLRPLGYADPDRLYLVLHRALDQPDNLGDTTPGNFADLRRDSTRMQPMAAFWQFSETLTGRGEPQRLIGVRSIGSVLQVLGVQPALGRLLTDADGEPGAPAAMVLSHGLWERSFGSNAGVIGTTAAIEGVPHTIVGVMPASFAFPDATTDFWGAAVMPPRLRMSRTEYFLQIVGRLRPGADEASARAELEGIMARLRKEYPDANSNVGIDMRPLLDALVGPIRRPLWILMGTVACVLLIACANLGNLLLARATGRQREIAVRQAIGAGRLRLARQLLTESVVLALAGGAAGIAVGRWLLTVLVAWLPASAAIPRNSEASLDRNVLLFTFAIAAAAGLLFGLTPALQLSHRAPAAVLRESGRSSTSRSPLRSALVIGEIAVALMLLAGAGLLVRSFLAMSRVNPGFHTTNLLTFRVTLPNATYADGPRRVAFVNRSLDRVKSLPGVTSAAAASSLPVETRGSAAWFNIIARPAPQGTTPPIVFYRVVTSDYFGTLGVPLVRGRLLTDRDGLEGTPSVLISESTARRYWIAAGAGDPIGAEIYLGAPDNKLFPHATVVGIVKDVKLVSLDSGFTDVVYGLHSLMPFWSGFTFALRTAGDPASLAGPAREAIHAIDPSLAITRVRSMDDILRSSVAPARASMLLLVLFAAMAVVMAAIGVFGVMSYAVNLRAREMGIRLALGAGTNEVRRLVLRQGMLQAVTGVAIGVAGAIWLTRVMTTLLFDVQPGDPLTLACVSGVLLATAAVACYVPARRATRVDPLVVLRTE